MKVQASSLRERAMRAESVSEARFGDSKTIVERLAELKSIPLSYSECEFSTPKDSGEKVALARLLVKIFASLKSTEIILYISEWGIWPSSENMEIFDSYRLAKGETRTLEEAPIHRFASANDPTLLGLLCLALYFIWGVELFNSEGKCLFSLNHDEWFEIRTSNPSALEICNLAINSRRF
jgi:hypothetical protein